MWLFISLFGKFVGYVVSIYVCVGSNFLNGDVVSGVSFHCTYYVGYEEFIAVVILGGWVYEFGLVVGICC